MTAWGAQTATAQSLLPELNQPQVNPRTMIVMRPLQLYTDPTAQAREVALSDFSPTQVRTAIESFYRHDARYHVIDDDAPTLLARLARTPTQSDLATVARQTARLGIAHYRSYQITAAIDELTSATRAFEATTLRWTDPETVAEAYLFLALAYLERSRQDEARRLEDRNLARRAFRSLIRIAPSRTISQDIYPPDVVALYQSVYLDLLNAEEDALGLTHTELRWLSDRLDVDLIAGFYATVTRERVVYHLRVYDRLEDRVVLQEAFQIDDPSIQLEDYINGALSVATACQSLSVVVEADDDTDEAGHLYLAVSVSGGFYAQIPTRRQFPHRGVHYALTYMATQTVGIYLSNAFWFSGRDPFGDLVGRIDSLHVSAGALAVARWPRWRVYGGGGVAVARTGPINATTSFWCSVSQGEPFIFDEGRSCRAQDIVSVDATVYLGVETRIGASARLIGPLWVDLQLSNALYALPFNPRAIDFPIAAHTGLLYRF